MKKRSFSVGQIDTVWLYIEQEQIISYDTKKFGEENQSTKYTFMGRWKFFWSFFSVFLLLGLVVSIIVFTGIVLHKKL